MLWITFQTLIKSRESDVHVLSQSKPFSCEKCVRHPTDNAQERVLWAECLCPPSSCSNPVPQGDGVRRWGLWEVMRSWGWTCHDGISVLIKETTESSLTPSSRWGHSEKMSSMNQEAGSNQTLKLPLPWPWTSRLQNWEKSISVV